MACKYLYKGNWYSEEEVKKLIDKDIPIDSVLTEFLSSFAYTVEINTAKEQVNREDRLDEIEQSKYPNKKIGDIITLNNNQQYRVTGFTRIDDIDDWDGNNKVDAYTLEQVNKIEKPTQYYSNLTVPGGTNYTENEIATPAITPSIKGHAQFSTDNGIGWFRSDEQERVVDNSDRAFINLIMNITESKDLTELSGKLLSNIQVGQEADEKIKEFAGNAWRSIYDAIIAIRDEQPLTRLQKENLQKAVTLYQFRKGSKDNLQLPYKNVKTRRILEVQSEIFQKGRDIKSPDEIIQELQKQGKLKIKCD